MTLLKETAMVRLMGLAKIPMLFYVSPSVLEVSETRCAIRINLGYRTRNHLGSMYFGALCAGADCAGGLLAMSQIRSKHPGVHLIFKDFQANFLKRADGDVVFTCDDGAAVSEALAKTSSGERITLPVTVIATVPAKYGSEPVARFTLGLSLKKKG